jgi:hypothetical protein
MLPIAELFSGKFFARNRVNIRHADGDIMDIRSGGGYPCSALSNFAPHRFVLDGVECASMEGLLQSLKLDKAQVEVCEVCKLIGKAAKHRGGRAQYGVTKPTGLVVARRDDETRRARISLVELLESTYKK